MRLFLIVSLDRIVFALADDCWKAHGRVWSVYFCFAEVSVYSTNRVPKENCSRELFKGGECCKTVLRWIIISPDLVRSFFVSFIRANVRFIATSVWRSFLLLFWERNENISLSRRSPSKVGSFLNSSISTDGVSKNVLRLILMEKLWGGAGSIIIISRTSSIWFGRRGPL